MNSNLPPEIKLVFLIGAPRSGTTWLQLLLSASPHIATSVETHLFSVYTRSLFWGWKHDADGPDPIGLPLLITKQEYFRLVRQFSSSILLKILATKPGASVILEKTPDHATCWRDILEMYPSAHFIHLIRDPRAVTASLLAGSKGWAPWEPREVSKNCMHWLTNVESARQIGAMTDKYIEVFYRDLKENGIATLQYLFNWCGISVSEDEIEKILCQHNIDRLRAGTASTLALRYRARGEGFFRNGEIEGWRSELSRRQVALIEKLAGELMDEFGYACETTRWHRRRSWYVSRAAAMCAWVASGLSGRFGKYADALSSWM